MKRWRIIIALLVAGSLVTAAGVALAQQAGWIAPLAEEYSRVWKGAYDETAKYDLPPAGREAVAHRVLDAHIATRSAPNNGGPSPTPTPTPTPSPTPTPTLAPSPTATPTPQTTGTGGCGQTITSDGTVNGQWAAGCESAERPGSHARYYSFALESESYVTISLHSTEADPWLYLRERDARSGSFLHENDDHDNAGLPRGTDSQIREHLAAGTYTIEATTIGEGETGRFTLTLSRLRSGEPGVPTPTPTPTPTPVPLTVSDIDGYRPEYRITIFVSSIGVNLSMSRWNVFTVGGTRVKLDSDGNLHTRSIGSSLADRYHWSCNPVNSSSGESRYYASDEHGLALSKTNLDSAPLFEHSLGRRVQRICSGEEAAPSSTVERAWTGGLQPLR